MWWSTAVTRCTRYQARSCAGDHPCRRAEQDGGAAGASIRVGHGRSGTSALTRLLSLCGGALPTALGGATKDNPLGHWEPRAALYLNEAILRRHGSAGYDPTLRMQEEGAFDAEEKAACIAKIREFLATLPAAPFVVLKEQRISGLCRCGSRRRVWPDSTSRR